MYILITFQLETLFSTVPHMRHINAFLQMRVPVFLQWCFMIHRGNKYPEDHWSCISHLSAEDMLKSGVIEERKFKSIESE